MVVSAAVPGNVLSFPRRRQWREKKMLRIAVIFSTILLLAATVARTQNPTPTPEAALKVSTNLVSVDVRVTDEKGRNVDDLTLQDFEIYENGVKQKVTTFSFIRSTVPDNSPKLSEVDRKLQIPAQRLRSDQVRRTIALVVDDLSLSFESTARVRSSLRNFVDRQMAEGDLVAIIRTGAGIGALQQFTNDKRQLYAAIERVRWNPQGRGRLTSFNPLEPTMLERAAALGDTLIDVTDLQEEDEFQDGFDEFQGSVFSTGTLGALRYIVGGMKDLRGRKSIVLFSDGFRIYNETEGGITDGQRVRDFLDQLVGLAKSNSVVIYPIDARGLETTSMTVRDEIITSDPSDFGEIYDARIQSRNAELFDTQTGLVYLARETGGKAFINRNDFGGMMEDIMLDQSYYLLGYEPDVDAVEKNAGRFNKLEVKVARPNLKLQFRSGFFGKSNQESGLNPRLSAEQRLANAIASPFGYNDVAVRFRALFMNEKKQGSLLRSLLFIDARDLKFVDAPGGMKKTNFEILGISFGDNGTIVDQVATGYSMTVKASELEKLRREGFIYYFTFPVKKAGAYQMRVAFRDIESGKIGSATEFVEVPNLKKTKLTVSSLVLESTSMENWRKISTSGEPRRAINQAPDLKTLNRRLTDTSLRKFSRNSVLRFGYEVYNAKLDQNRRPRLSTQIRLFRDGVLVLEGVKAPLELLDQQDFERTSGLGAIDLGSQTPSGDYILQIVITDDLVKSNKNLATQFVQFEIVD